MKTINLTDEQYQTLKTFAEGFDDCLEVFAEHMPIDDLGNSLPTGTVIALLKNAAPDENSDVEVATFDDIDEADRFVDVIKVLRDTVKESANGH